MRAMQPVLGHVLSGGGPLNVALLVLGAATAFAGMRLRDRKPGAAAWARGVTVAGIALFGLGLVIDASPGPAASNASVRIVSPSAGEEVPAGRSFEISVEVRNGTLVLSPSDRNGGHLHLYVDGRSRQMPSSTQAQVTLEPGIHVIRVEYVDYRHVSFSPEISTTIEVEAV